MTDAVGLRDVIESDLPLFFEHQRDADACEMAGFPSREWEPFLAHWKKILSDASTTNKTILLQGQAVGNVVCFEQAGERDVGYWIGKEYWGKGIATQALAAFVNYVTVRPLYARVVRHNVASRRVLEKCGFVLKGEEDEEFVLVLV